MVDIAPAWSNVPLDVANYGVLYEWLDKMEFSRPKSQIEKDFSDGRLVAEILAHYFPNVIDLREYKTYVNIKQRIGQWNSLNSLLYSLLGLQIPSHVITQLSIGKTGIIQNFLNNLRICILMNSAAKDSKTIDHIVLYEWLSQLKFSRPVAHFERDFSDGFLVAEILQHYFPYLVDSRNFITCSKLEDRVAQWSLLNMKVLPRIGLKLPVHVIHQLSMGKSGVIQSFLVNLKTCIAYAHSRNYLPLPDSQVLFGARAYQDAISMSLPFGVDNDDNSSPHPPYLKSFTPFPGIIRPSDLAINSLLLPHAAHKQTSTQALKTSRIRKAVEKLSLSQPELNFGSRLPPINTSNASLAIPQAQGAAALPHTNKKSPRNLHHHHLNAGRRFEVMTADAVVDIDQMKQLRNKLRRMEVILQAKNSKIQDLSFQLERFNYIRRH